MLSVKEIVESSNGKLINGNENLIPEKYVLDSREVSGGEIFVPIVGQNVDSHKYIIDVVKKGAIGYFVNSNFKEKEKVINESLKINKNLCIIEVENAQNAIYDAALYNRNKHIDIPIIAITGSVGKTSTREMIASIFREEKITLVTEKNYNSCIGIPLMILKIKDQDICILESGIDSFGEMELESKLLKPDVAVITNIGTAHIGTFNTMENTLSEKIQITNYIKGKKKLVVNGDNKLLQSVSDTQNYQVIKYNLDSVKDIEQTENSITIYTDIYGVEEKIVINEIGIHNVQNALCAIKVAEIFNIKRENIIKGIEKYKNFSRRLEKIYTNDNILLIDDTYNASIDSMKSGLTTVDSLNGKRKIAVLGDMFDLGEHSDNLHIELGKIFSKLNFDVVYTVGEAAEKILINASKYVKESKHFKTKEELISAIKELLRSGDIVYFKASNGMKFNELVEKIKNEKI